MNTMINERWLDQFSHCGLAHHHGYVCHPADKTIVVFCGANESTRRDCWTIDVSTGIATHKSNSETITITPADLYILRTYVEECKEYESVSIDRCDELTCMEFGCSQLRTKESPIRPVINGKRLRPDTCNDNKNARFVDKGPHRVTWTRDCGGHFEIKFKHPGLAKIYGFDSNDIIK